MEGIAQICQMWGCTNCRSPGAVRPAPAWIRAQFWTGEPKMNAIQVRDIAHVVLRVRDLDTMLTFYAGVLGCPVERRLEDLGLIQLRAGASLIDLVPVDGPLGLAGGRAPSADGGGHNLDHVCLRLETFDESAIRSHLVAHGIAAGRTSTRYGAEGNGPSIYITDPEGNTVELKGPPDGGMAP